jgi:hypothetical protein
MDYEQIVIEMLEALNDYAQKRADCYKLPMHCMNEMIEVIAPSLCKLVESTSEEAVKQALINLANQALQENESDKYN